MMVRSVGVIAALMGLLSIPTTARAIHLPQQVQVSPDVCFSAALADLDRIEWNARNAELVLGNASMNQLLGGASAYSAEQIAEAERDRQAGPSKIAAARAEVARWRAAGGRTSPDSTTYVPAQLDALLAACAAAPVISRAPTPASTPQIAQERWIFKANAGGGGFGWRQPPEGSIPATVEVISRSSTPIMIAGREARWSYYTVRLDCVAQTTTVTSHLITTDTGERIVDVPEGPKPINSDTPPQAAGMVICNRAAFPGSRAANSREEMLAALRGSATAARGSATSMPPPPMALIAPPTVWEGQYMSALEPLYVLAPDAPNAAFYRSLSRPAANGRHEMWVVAVLRGVSTDASGAYDLGASLYSIDCSARTTQVLRGQVYREMAPVRDTPIEPVVALQPGTVTHQMIIQVCDGGPLPAFAGSLSQVRRAVPLASSSR